MLKNSVKKSDIPAELRLYACDFETTTAEISKDHTRVWSFAVDEIGHYQPEIFGSIEDFFDFCGDVNRGFQKRLYFHNLKFDGEFILYHALHVLKMQTALINGVMARPRQVLENEIVYAISDAGQWYFIFFVYKGCQVEIRDSLKVFPMPLKQIGKDICTRYKKTDMEYNDKTSLEDCSASDIDYIKNDVLVLSEALDKLFCLHDEKTPFGPVHSLTIGSACLQRFKELNYGTNKNISIHLDKTELDYSEAGSSTMDEYIRHAYRGGYCYVNKAIQGKIIDRPGFVADVNSLYPFVMCTEYSGFVYPYGKGKYCKGAVTEKMIESQQYYFYARILVSFRLKPGYVPTIQKKKSFMFANNLYLECSAVHDNKRGVYVGPELPIELTLAKDDYITFFEHYEILSFQALDYIAFMTAPGLCDPYVKEMAKIKIEATKEKNRGVRTLAKLFSNNLYGQFAKSQNSSFKVCEIGDEGFNEYHIVPDYSKAVVNIAIGAAVTAHARFYQIQTIQNNLDRFLYSDTDSLHCIGDPSDFVGKLDPAIYGAYDIENTWTKACFVRQKTYIEALPDGSYNICCAGMTPQQKEYFRQNHKFEDFKIGLHIPGGKLQPQRVPGGVILKEVDFTLK